MSGNSVKRNIVILGSTGSIGENACWLADRLRDDLQVVGLAAGGRWERLAEQARLFGCRQVAIADAAAAPLLAAAVPANCRVTSGTDSLVEMVTAPDVDVVLCAITGTGGLIPVLEAIRAGKDIALASKEVLVMAGELVMAEVERCGVRMLPVDSEHSALFQCLEGRQSHEVARLILTASGGPFRQRTAAEMQAVTYAEALAHPTWDMGPKITVDSATMMNKALELIEACRLFNVPPGAVEVVIHPQSVVHSMVEFADGSIIAQLGSPDMRLPIQYALLYPEHRDTGLPRCDLTMLSRLDFDRPDEKRFPALRLAREALAAGGTLPAVLNAANEVAVELFRHGNLAFPGIWQLVEGVMRKHTVMLEQDLAVILEADAWARRTASQMAGVV